MRQVKHLLEIKGRAVFSVAEDATVFEAIQLMAEKNVGALAVKKGDQLVGIVSERDYARKVILKDRSSRETRVAEIMTASVVSVALDATVDECMRLCTDGRLRHLPVLDDGTLVGMVSIGDLVKATISEQQETINQLESYIAG
ncbi:MULTISPECIES: CBS domain-containing protein [unclassified Luteibacter]|uniref:CBS domain-containing protein n=1 Tax=unclassified Luteibacter TaxID=2620188 RepID=UPI0008CCB654|nr:MULTISPECIES: CBS domain-containing protein [unclassified Luteibacter]MDR6936829.1 CBS domain-containing protein [Luteibacter sp. 3190]SEP05270.1 CBS domain-containing protein [Luteibacter sp. UNC138MFCol5.1]SEW17116.1 CBS domain-containing protein [Luteibacter sp. 329MFSha]